MDPIHPSRPLNIEFFLEARYGIALVTASVTTDSGGKHKSSISSTQASRAFVTVGWLVCWNDANLIDPSCGYAVESGSGTGSSTSLFERMRHGIPTAAATAAAEAR